MTTTLERVSGALYRVGMRQDNGNTSLASYAASPARIVAGELAASVADAIVSRSRARSVQSPERPTVIGPRVP
jgi:hypothetical protein